jgi:hypothetical protein
LCAAAIASECANEPRYPEARFGHPRAPRVPGDRGGAKPELARKDVEHCGTLRPEASERTYRPGERGDKQAPAQLGQTVRDLGDASKPDRDREAKGNRRGVLAVGAPDAGRGTASLGPSGRAR